MIFKSIISFLNTKSIISYMQYSVLMELYRTKHNKLHNEQKVILYNVLGRKVICKYFGKQIAYYLPRKYSLTLVWARNMSLTGMISRILLQLIRLPLLAAYVPRNLLESILTILEKNHN